MTTTPTPTTTTEIAAVTGAVGSAHTRVEGRDKVTGAARYAGEIPFAELAHGWLVLSTVARGRIRSVALAAASARRDIVVVGRAMRRAIDVATELGYLHGLPPFLDEDAYAQAGWALVH